MARGFISSNIVPGVSVHKFVYIGLYFDWIRRLA